MRASAVNLINSSRCVRCVAVLLLCCACVTAGPLTQSEVRALATRTWNAPTDEVFDATWLTLRARGFDPRPDTDESFHIKDPDGFGLQIGSSKLMYVPLTPEKTP